MRDRLLALIRSWDLEFDGPIRDDTALITSGVFDSQALFNLMLWIEEQIGATIDPNSLDLVEAWDTVASVVAFIERRRQAAGTDAGGMRGGA